MYPSLFHEYEEIIFSSKGLNDYTILHQTFSCLFAVFNQKQNVLAHRVSLWESLCRWTAKTENSSFNFIPQGNMFCGETQIHTHVLQHLIREMACGDRLTHTYVSRWKMCTPNEHFLKKTKKQKQNRPFPIVAT